MYCIVSSYNRLIQALLLSLKEMCCEWLVCRQGLGSGHYL